MKRFVSTLRDLFHQPPWIVPAVFFLTGSLAVLAVATSAVFGLGFVLPQERHNMFLQTHYLKPFLGAILFFALFHALKKKSATNIPLGKTLLVDFYLLANFYLVLLIHFHFKWWMSFINPRLYDTVYYQTDLWLDPWRKAGGWFRDMFSAVPGIDRLYHWGFVFLFALAFADHAVFRRKYFYPMIFSIMAITGIGAVSYSFFPALGPFIFETGSNVLATGSQTNMLELFHHFQTHGPAWFNLEGGTYFTRPLAAMPSLHAGTSFIFLYYQIKSSSPWWPLFVILFGWIVIEAVDSKWHYVIDLPAGILLALPIIWIANTLDKKASS